MLLIRRWRDVGQAAGEQLVQTVLRGARRLDVFAHRADTTWSGQVAWEVTIGRIGQSSDHSRFLRDVLRYWRGRVWVKEGGPVEVERR